VGGGASAWRRCLERPTTRSSEFRDAHVLIN
jgi:hypothetical protein